MAKSKTGSFWLTETVVLTNNTATQGTIDLGAYVDVGDQQGVAVEQCDVIVQGFDTAGENFLSSPTNIFGTDGAVMSQVTDLSRGVQIIQANDRALIASGALIFEMAAGSNMVSMGPDVFPDTYGKLDEARMVVNDQLYCTAQTLATLGGNRHVYVTFRLKCRIVKLDKRDWMSIAIQSTAADN